MSLNMLMTQVKKKNIILIWPLRDFNNLWFPPFYNVFLLLLLRFLPSGSPGTWYCCKMSWYWTISASALAHLLQCVLQNVAFPLKPTNIKPGSDNKNLPSGCETLAAVFFLDICKLVDVKRYREECFDWLKISRNFHSASVLMQYVKQSLHFCVCVRLVDRWLCCCFCGCRASRWTTSVWLQCHIPGPSQCCDSLPSSGSLWCRKKVSNHGTHGLIFILPHPPLPLPHSPFKAPMATLPPVTAKAQSCRWRWWRASVVSRSASNSSANQMRVEFLSWTCCLVVWQPKMENWGTMIKCWPLMATTWGMVHLRLLPRSYRYNKWVKRISINFSPLTSNGTHYHY